MRILQNKFIEKFYVEITLSPFSTKDKYSAKFTRSKHWSARVYMLN